MLQIRLYIDIFTLTKYNGPSLIITASKSEEKGKWFSYESEDDLVIIQLFRILELFFSFVKHD